MPDGLLRLAYFSDAWFRTHFTLGAAAPWRRSGNVILPSDLSRIEDLSGKQQVWIDPAQWKERTKKAEELAAATQREQFEREVRLCQALGAANASSRPRAIHTRPIDEQDRARPDRAHASGHRGLLEMPRWDGWAPFGAAFAHPRTMNGSIRSPIMRVTVVMEPNHHPGSRVGWRSLAPARHAQLTS